MANWVREEIIIICSALKGNGWRPLRADIDEARDLSRLLQRTEFVPRNRRGEDFRSPDGVQRKMYDLSTLLPDYEGTPTKDGVTTKKVLKEFLTRPKR